MNHLKSPAISAFMLLILVASTACKSVDIEQLELGMHPKQVRAAFGKPVRVQIANRRAGSRMRRMLIEEYPSPPGHRLQLLYSIPIDLDELAAQGNLALARRIAPELADGMHVAALRPDLRRRLDLETASLVRFRRLAIESEESRRARARQLEKHK